VTDLVTEKSVNPCKVEQYRRDRIIENTERRYDRLKTSVKTDILLFFYLMILRILDYVRSVGNGVERSNIYLI